jgi:hypothetical protein
LYYFDILSLAVAGNLTVERLFEISQIMSIFEVNRFGYGFIRKKLQSLSGTSGGFKKTI